MEGNKLYNEMQGKTRGKPPDYKADGVAVWVNKKANGEKYLSIKIVGHEKIVAWANIPKDEPRPPEASLTKGDWKTRE